MPYTTIIAQIKAILEGVTGVEKVYDYMRWSDDWGTFINLFKISTGGANGYMITRVAAPEDRGVVTEHNHIKHTFRIYGIYQLNDALETEKTFQAQIDTVCNAFRTNNTLNSTVIDSEPIQVEMIQNRLMGSTLVHWCEMSLVATERLAFM